MLDVLKKLLSLYLLIGVIGAIFADDLNPATSNLETAVSEKRVQLFLSPGFSRVTVNGTSLSGIGLTGSLYFGVSPQWSFGVSVGQAFTSNINAFYVLIDLEASYALTGSAIRRVETTTVDGKRLSTSEEANSGGLRALFLVNQYFINTDSTSLPYSGFGLGLSYELPSESFGNYRFGVRLDRVTNDTSSIYPFTVFVGVGLWL